MTKVNVLEKVSTCQEGKGAVTVTRLGPFPHLPTAPWITMVYVLSLCPARSEL